LCFRDKKLSSVFVRFRAPLSIESENGIYVAARIILGIDQSAFLL
jgi:hypothetical protein